MKIFQFALLVCLAKSCILSALVTCSPRPIASCASAQSVIETWPREYLEYVGDRIRLSSCTGVIWLGDNELLSVGVHNFALDAYRFDPLVPRLTNYKNELLGKYQSAWLGQLENISISKDGSLVAISNNGQSAIHLYTVKDGQLTHYAQIPKREWWIHGVRISRDMDYLAYTIFGNPGQIVLYRILKDAKDKLRFKKSQVMDTNFFPQHPKAIDFSIDGRFVVVCFAINNSRERKSLSGSIAVYPFDKVNGKIDPTPVSTIGMSEELCVPEDLCFYPDGSCVLVTNHGTDTVTVHAFNQETGELGESRVLLQNPEAQLIFPHGLCLSPKGDYLAVTNYGDDTVKIYTISPSSH